MSKPTWAPGEIIADRYRLVAPLDRGGMGEVWRAEHATLHALVAIKLLDPDLLKSSRSAGREEVLARFLREAQAAATLRSPHVVQILDHGLHDGIPYITMELLDGESLADRLDRIPVLPFELTARIMTHVARAVGKAHEAMIIHRDLKPANIFLVRNDDEELAKVLDFGIAKLMRSPLEPQEGEPITRSGYLVGTPCYMSPEQLQGNRELDGRSDLWSMAVITFEAVVGRRPFESEAVGSLVLEVCAKALPVPSRLAAVPPGFDAWWAKAASREPADRFQSARELAEALRGVLAPDELSLSGPHRISVATMAAARTAASRRQDAPTLAVPSAALAAPSAALAGAAASSAAPGTARAVVSAIRPPSTGRFRTSRRAFFAAMAVGAVLGGVALVALWRSAPALVEPPAPSRPPAPAAPAPAPPEDAEVAPSAPEVAPSASEIAPTAAAPSSAAPSAAQAPRPAPRPTGSRRKDRLGF